MKNIIFNGMGVDTNKTDVGNYRITSKFLNKKKEKCFIEISHIEDNDILYGYVQQAYKMDGEIKKHCFRRFDQMYNTKFLLTKENVIKVVDRLFNCEFDEIEVIHYNGEYKTAWIEQ